MTYDDETNDPWRSALPDPRSEAEEKRRAEQQVVAWQDVWPGQRTTPDMFDLKSRVGYWEKNRPDDVAKVQLAIHNAGHTDLDISKGPTGIFGKPDNDGLMDLQRERGLNIDGKAFPGGETISNLKQNPRPLYETKLEIRPDNFIPISDKTSNQRDLQNVTQAASPNPNPYSEPQGANETGEREPVGATAATGSDITNYADNSYADGSDPNSHPEERDVNVVDGRRVYPPEKIKRALSKLFGEDIDDTEVWEDTLFGKLHLGMRATTRDNRIYTNEGKERFFSDYRQLLHEYFHVLRQWKPGTLTRLGYLVESTKSGYRDNKFEKEARRFADENLAKFHAMLKEPE